MTGRSGGKEKGGILEALSARFLFRGNVYRRIAAAMTLYAICVILLIGAVSHICVDLLIRKNLRLSMESNARQQAVKLSSSLDSVQEGLSNLSRNSLLVNALIDTSGNRPYINSFVKSYRPAGHESIRLTLCDFQGSPVASNLPTPIPYQIPEMIRQTVDRGLPFSTVLAREGANRGAWFLLAYPVVWDMTNRAEGVLVAEIPVSEIIVSRLSAPEDDDIGLRVRTGEQVLFSRNFSNGAGFQRFDIPLPTAAPMNSLGLAMQIENRRRISVWWLIPAYAVSGGILILLSMVLARRISFSVTSHLQALGAVAQRVAESGSLDSHAEVAGPDDVQVLASSFNAMIDRVRSAKENLEQRVEERTAELSVANDELRRLNRDKELAIKELQEALNSISTLRGLLPICAACKKIRDDKGYWNRIEDYVAEHTEADFSHAICPDCAKKLYGKYLE